MPPLTRSMARRNQQMKPPSPVVSSSPAASPPKQTSKPKKDKTKTNTTRKAPVTITMEHCKEFVQNPNINPLTGKSIVLGGPKYNELLKTCQEMMNKKFLEEDIVINLLSEKDNFAVNSCLNVVNTATEEYIQHPLYMFKVGLPITSAFAERILNTCANTHKIALVRIYFKDGIGDMNLFKIPVILKAVQGRIQVGNFDIIHEKIRSIFVSYLDTATTADNVASKQRVISTLKVGIQQLLDADVLVQDQREELEDVIMELTAMQEGIVIEKSKTATPLSSSVRSSNRSKSLVVSSALPALPKKRRAEILEDLQKTCIEMRDMITLDDFEDMKKKQLQLVVKVGPRNREGQQRCYYVKNIYDYVKTAIRDGKLPKEPVSKSVITSDEISKVIMPMMRYIDPNVEEPGVLKKKKYPNMQLELRLIMALNGRPYYRVELNRIVGKRLALSRIIGYIPAYVETSAADVNSATVVAKVRELFDNGRLLNERMMPRVHLNKSIAYWEEGNVVQKLNHMMNELNYF